MFSITDIVRLIPDNLKQAAVDALVQTVVERGERLLSDSVLDKIKGLRSDAAFRRQFDAGLQRGLARFVDEYQLQDEDLVAAIAAAPGIFEDDTVRAALITILEQPGRYLVEEQDAVMRSFTSVFPNRLNRERVNRAVSYLLKCIAQELWHLSELRPIYSLEFQRITAETNREQLAVQKAQLATLESLNVGIRDALLELTDALSEQKLLEARQRNAALPSSPPTILHNLPQPDYEQFIGREEELAQVKRILRPYPHSQNHLVTIDGIGGIGKSALALEVAHQYLRQYDDLPSEERFDAIIWTSAKRDVLTAEGIKPRYQVLQTLDDIYAAIAITLQREDINHAAPGEQAEAVRNALARQRTLLIVDNLETIDDEAVLNFLRELPAPTKAIVTTRHRIDVAYPVRLRGMDKRDAKELASREAVKKQVQLATEETERLIKRTGGVPLAIVLSIAQMGYGHEVATVLHRLGQPNNDIIRFCFEGSLAQIKNRPAYRLLTALSLFVPDGSRQALGEVAALSDLDRDDGLVTLEKLSLVNKVGDRFSFLPITKTFAESELRRDPEEAYATGRRWVDYFIDLYRGREDMESTYRLRYTGNQFPDDGHNFIAAIEWANEHGTAEDVFWLSIGAISFLDSQGRWNTLIELTRRVLDLARTTGNKAMIGRLMDTRGWIYEQRGEFTEAETAFHESLAAYQEIGDKEGEAMLLQRLSGIQRKRGNYQEAQELIDRARLIARDLGIGDFLALIDTQEGKLARDLQQWERSWQLFSKVQEWFEKRTEETPRDEDLAVGTWGHLAIVAYHMGRPAEAKDLCLRSLDYFEEFGTKGYLATLKYRLALAEAALGNHQSALQYVNEAIEWYERLGMKPDLPDALALKESLLEE